jgi:hypothetical protein
LINDKLFFSSYLIFFDYLFKYTIELQLSKKFIRSGKKF